MRRRNPLHLPYMEQTMWMAKRLIGLCMLCIVCQPLLAQREVQLADLPPFERAVVCVKYLRDCTVGSTIHTLDMGIGYCQGRTLLPI